MDDYKLLESQQIEDFSKNSYQKFKTQLSTLKVKNGVEEKEVKKSQYQRLVEALKPKMETMTKIWWH